MTGAFIAAIEYVLPKRRITNAELAQLHPQWKMEQVALRSGVENRYWSNPDETALDLGEQACRKLFTRTGFRTEQINAILFCTQSPDYIMPPNACLLQHRLGLPRTIAALDYSLACSGFVYGVYLSNALVQSGMAGHVLLITAESYSKWIHLDDRGPMTLFGDGAAATLISAGVSGIGSFALATDGGEGASCFIVPAGGARMPRSPETALPKMDKNGNVRAEDNLYMNGAAVLDFVKKEIPTLVRDLLDRENLTLDDLDLIVFHQASQISLDLLHKTLHIPKDKQFIHIADIGNTVSASIPIALREAELQGKLKSGMRVMLVGFGVGLSWGGCIITWQ